MDFYIGQIFEGSYSPTAACWCNANNAYIDVIGEKRYEIKAIPEPPAPTREEITQSRVAYRREYIDDKTLERNRKMANGSWTEEDEVAYLALDAEVTAYIEENLPYPTDLVEEEKMSSDINIGAITEALNDKTDRQRFT